MQTAKRILAALASSSPPASPEARQLADQFPALHDLVNNKIKYMDHDLDDEEATAKKKAKAKAKKAAEEKAKKEEEEKKGKKKK